MIYTSKLGLFPLQSERPLAACNGGQAHHQMPIRLGADALALVATLRQHSHVPELGRPVREPGGYLGTQVQWLGRDQRTLDAHIGLLLLSSRH